MIETACIIQRNREEGKERERKREALVNRSVSVSAQRSVFERGTAAVWRHGIISLGRLQPVG